MTGNGCGMCTCVSEVWLEVDTVSIWEPTISETSLSRLVFTITLLGRSYSFKYADEAMRPLSLQVVGPVLEPDFASSVSKTWDAVEHCVIN